MTEIRVLAVRQPWASLIVEGLKTIEVRSRPTNIRERVAIYATNHWYTEKEKKDMFDQFASLLDNKVISDYAYNYAFSSVLSGGERGKIIGTVEITQSFKCYSSGDYEEYENLHLCSALNFDLLNTHFWSLDNPVKFSSPIPYKPPKGAVVWSKTDIPEEL